MTTTTRPTMDIRDQVENRALWTITLIIVWASAAALLLFPTPTVVGTVLAFLTILTAFGGLGAIFAFAWTADEPRSPAQSAFRCLFTGALPLVLVGLLWAIDAGCLTKPECVVDEDPLGVSSAWMGGAFLVALPFVVRGVWVLLTARLDEQSSLQVPQTPNANGGDSCPCQATPQAAASH